MILGKFNKIIGQLLILLVFCSVMISSSVSAQEQGKKRFYPKDVDDYNELTAVSEYKDDIRVHEKFWMDDKIIAPRTHAPSWIKFKDVNFDKGYNYLSMRYSVGTNLGRTVAEVRLDSPDLEGRLIGDFRTENTGGWNKYIDRYIPLEDVENTHDLYIVFEHSANYRFFELRNNKPKDYKRSQPAEEYQQFVRPENYDLQDEIHHFDEPMDISKSLIDQCLLQLASDGGGQFTRGELSDKGSRQASAILATAAAQGNQDPFIKLKLLEVLKGGRYSILISKQEVKFVHDVGLPYTIAMIWHDQDIRSELTKEEKKSIKLYAKGMLIDQAFKLAEYTPGGRARGAQRFRMNGDPIWTGGNPNYYDRDATNFMYASSILGWENVEEILKNYDHMEFLEQLSNSEHTGLSVGLYDYMNTTFMKLVGRTRYDASTPEKKAQLVEEYIHGIIKNEEKGKPFFRGNWLADLMENPGQMIYSNTIDRTYDKRARQGDYIGQRGMAHEFSTYDGGDEALGASLFLRDDLNYCRYALVHLPLYKLFLQYTGHWEQMDSEKRQLVNDRMSVALSDLQAKSTGYWSTNFRGAFFKTNMSKRRYILMEQVAADMGHIRPRIYSENFEKNLPMSVGWKQFGNWNKEVVDTWTGRPQHRMDSIAPDHVMQSGQKGTQIMVNESQISDFNIYTQMVVDEWSEDRTEAGLVGRFKDENNYIKMVYNSQKQALQIVRVKNGDHSLLAEKSYEIEPGKMNYVRGEFSGQDLALYINSQRLLTAEDNTLEKGKIGIFTNQTQAKFDNILVTAASYGDLGHHDMQNWLEEQLGK